INAKLRGLDSAGSGAPGTTRKGFVFCAAKCRCAKGKTQENKERTMQTERAELYFQQGSSDKVYHLQLEGAQDQWAVQAQWGRRLAVQKSEAKYSGIKKLGQIIPIEARLAESLDRVQAHGFLADGEITDSRFYIWDLLSVNDTDLRIQPYEIRYVHLTQHFRGVSDVLRVCETAMTTKAKRDFVKKMHSANAEGCVCKNRNAAYAGGRAGQ